MSDFLNSMVRGNRCERAIRELRNSVISLNKALGLEEVDRDEMLATYKNLCIEELKEINEAIDKKDKVNFVKEIIDFMVVGFYNLYLMEAGFDVDLDTGDYDLEGCVVALNDIETSGYGDYEDVLWAQLVHVCDIFNLLNIDHKFAVEEVLRENLSKFPTVDTLHAAWWFCTSDEEAIKTQKDSLDDTIGSGRYSDITHSTFKLKGEERIVFWAGKEWGNPIKKYIKPDTYRKCDLSEVFYET